MGDPDIDSFLESFKYSCKKHNVTAAVLIVDPPENKDMSEKVKFRIDGPEMLVKIIHLGVQYFDLGIQKTKEKIEKPDLLAKTKNFFSIN